MPVPQLTEEQRKKALAKSLESRKARAIVKADLKAGKKTLKSVLSNAKTDSIVGRIKVTALLQSLPGVGKAKATAIMEEIGIPENRRAAGLGANQVEKLLETF
jgi:DNA uptake protein ComE-like DNA-binding protein